MCLRLFIIAFLYIAFLFVWFNCLIFFIIYWYNACFVSTTEDVEALLEFAKLEKSELKGHVQTLSFSQQLDNESLVLMEMDANVLSSLSQGDE